MYFDVNGTDDEHGMVFQPKRGMVGGGEGNDTNQFIQLY